MMIGITKFSKNITYKVEWYLKISFKTAFHIYLILLLLSFRELLEINHIQTIYNIFVALLILFVLNTLVYDFVENGR